MNVILETRMYINPQENVGLINCLYFLNISGYDTTMLQYS